VHEGIVRHVLQHPTDLLVVQPSRHHGPWMLGYADYKMIEMCPCPLLLVKTTRPYVDCRIIAAVDPSHEHDKPAALDDVILDAAAVLCGALSAELLVFHACVPWAHARPNLRRQPASARDDAEAAYRHGVEARVMELARRHDITPDHVELVEGHAAEELPFLARRESADIVAMGAVSRSLLERIMIGHTAETLLDGLDCDMLIVKPPGFRGRLSLRAAHDVEHEVTA
jgi:universal stress protein E